MKIDLKLRTGFNPCCDKHIYYMPCNCAHYEVIITDADGLVHEQDRAFIRSLKVESK